MGTNVYMKSVNLSAAWTPLSGTPLVMNATLIASAKNAADMDARFRGGTAAKWPPGAAAIFEGVDLSEIEVKGTSGDLALVVAYAR